MRGSRLIYTTITDKGGRRVEKFYVRCGQLVAGTGETE